jgi:exonuclease SbcC
MKPIKLTIQAFGPFVGREEIDFTQLGNNPLFLINGPTGSGKSSILDAICFALYGQTTGAERDASQMRCDQADPKTLTEVTLDFSLGDKKYRIKRTPFQERAKERGEGLTSHTGTAELNEINVAGELDLIVARKIKQATDEIEQLTGLNVEQFRQVMVLPQGKFRELLLANSNERQQIFSQLFQTNIYKKIEDTLKEKARVIRESVKAHQNKIKGILEGADISSEEAVDESIKAMMPALEKAKTNKKAANEMFLSAVSEKKSAEVLLRNFTDQAEAQLSLKEKNKQKPAFDEKQKTLGLSEFANKIRPVFNELTRIKNDKQELVSEINKIHSSLALAESEYEVAGTLQKKCKDDVGAIDNINQDLIKLKRFEVKVDELESAVNTANASERIYLTSKDDAENARSRYDTKTKEKEWLEIRITDIQNELSDIAPKQARLRSLGEQKKLLRKLVDNKSQYIHLKTQVARAKEHAEDLSEIFEKSLNQARTLEMYWHAGQAVILAGKLEAGEPCPVCGSEDHPQPAIAEDSKPVVSKEQVDDARILSEKNRENMQTAKNSLTDINSQIDAITKYIKEIERELKELVSDGPVPKNNYSAALEEIEITYIKLEKEISSIESLQNELTKNKSDLVSRRVEIEKLHATLDECKTKADEDNERYINDQSAVLHIEKELPEEFRNKAELLQAIQNLHSRAQLLTDAFDKAQAHYDACKENVTKLVTSLHGLNSRKEVLTKQENNQQEKWLKSLHSSPFETEQQYQDSILDDDAVSALRQDIDDYHETLNKLKGALQQHEKILKGKQKPDIESLTKLLDEKKQKFEIADATWNELVLRHTQLKDVKIKLKNAHEENKKLEAEYAIYGTLSEVANGRTGNKISLQRFVLGVLLDDVLIEASSKLYKMTNGRYQLLRKQDRSKGGGASGLELDVEDSYTGKTRSVATLSGGESFMAALALALGLSDVVQAYAGGIRLDALFIDEGFGSLDQESLDLAIKTLVDLQETGRMIGIISHVSELKEQMALRLDVISTKTGSSIKMLVA